MTVSSYIEASRSSAYPNTPIRLWRHTCAYITFSLFVFLGACADYENNDYYPEHSIQSHTPTPARLYTTPPFGLTFTCALLECSELKELKIENRGGSVLGIEHLSLPQHDSFQINLFKESSPGWFDSIDFPSRQYPIFLQAAESIILRVHHRPSAIPQKDKEKAIQIHWFDGRKPQSINNLNKEKLPIHTLKLKNATPELKTTAINMGYVAPGNTKIQNIHILNPQKNKSILAVRHIDWQQHKKQPLRYGLGWLPHADPHQAIKIPIVYQPKHVQTSRNTSLIYIHGQKKPLLVDIKATSHQNPKIRLDEIKLGRLQYGAIPYGQMAKKTLTFHNDGGRDAMLTIETLGISDGMVLDWPKRRIIKVLESTSISMRLSCQQGGQHFGQLRATLTSIDNDGLDTALDSTDIKIEAFCDKPEINVMPRTIEFPLLAANWQRKSLPLRISNHGHGPLTIEKINIENKAEVTYRIKTSKPLPLTLQPGDPDILVFVHVKTHQEGSIKSMLQIKSNDVYTPEVYIPVELKVDGCEKVCPLAYATADCSQGRCQIAACTHSWYDTNNNPDDGCECSAD
ncbi:MAG TPA: hypothetical protein EYO58_07355, partial [Flavobacteriales bacterium]|nr:hypothetical protein [Flavobacteriales bacterium]